jgi:hypothetical protein
VVAGKVLHQTESYLWCEGHCGWGVVMGKALCR